MASILVIAHRPLASALVAAAQHVYSRDPCAAMRRLLCLDVAPDAQAEATLERARALLQEADHGDGVLVLADLYGATPGNVAAKLAQPGRVEVIAGVNLPMLLRALCYGDSPLEELANKALAGGSGGLLQIPPRTAADAADGKTPA